MNAIEILTKDRRKRLDELVMFQRKEDQMKVSMWNDKINELKGEIRALDHAIAVIKETSQIEMGLEAK